MLSPFRPSVCRLSVCDVGAPYSAGWNFRQFLSPYDSPGTLVFWCQNSLVGDAPFPLKFAFKVSHPFHTAQFWPISAQLHSASTAVASEISSISTYRKSTPSEGIIVTNFTDDRQTDGMAIAYSEREREFTSAKNRKIAISQPRFERFRRNLAWWCSLTLLTVPTVKNLKIQKSKMAVAAIFKNWKITISRPRFDRFWRNLA